MLLVVTNKTDLACDYLILRLKEKHIPFTRLNTEDFGAKYGVDLSIRAGRPDFTIRFSHGVTLTPAMIDAVYFRQPIAPEPPEDLCAPDRAFAKQEIGEQLRSLWRFIDHRKWINHPRNLWLASNKLEQLSVANTIGFTTPDTLVTCSRQSLTTFFARHDHQVIGKAVKHGFSYHDDTATLATTQRLGSSYLDRFTDYAVVPMIYQNEVPKIFDVRVTIVGDDVFATAIHSQVYRETEVDWRSMTACDITLHHQRIALPPAVTDSCRQMTRHFDLKYSAIDLVLGTDGVFYFLEMNPNGQWAWIEQETGYPIRDALIRCMGYNDAVEFG